MGTLPFVDFGGHTYSRSFFYHCCALQWHILQKHVQHIFKCTMHNNKNIHINCATMRKVVIVHVCFAPTICCACKYDHCDINHCACCTFVAPLLCTIQVLCMQYYCTLHKHCIPVAQVLCIRCNCCALCIRTNITTWLCLDIKKLHFLMRV